MAKSLKSTPKSQIKKAAMKQSGIKNNIKFIVLMPGKGSWNRHAQHLPAKRFHKISHHSEDLALEDYKANFLMQREYLID